jgi:hypothetical protein
MEHSPLSQQRGFEELVEAPRGGIVAALRERGRYYSGEGIEGGLDASARFGKGLEQGKLDRADLDHSASIHLPRDGSVTTSLSADECASLAHLWACMREIP